MRIVQEIRRIMVDLSSGCEKKVAADKLLLMLQRLVPQFRGNRQQDAHEFLRYVLDCTNGELQQSMRRINGTNSRTNAVCSINRKHSKNTIVQEIFGGSLQNEVGFSFPCEFTNDIILRQITDYHFVIAC